MPPRQQDHGGAMAPAIALRRLDELVHLGLREVFAAAQLGVGAALGRDWSIFGGADFRPAGLCRSKFRSPQPGLDGRHLGQIQ